MSQYGRLCEKQADTLGAATWLWTGQGIKETGEDGPTPPVMLYQVNA